MLFSHWLYFCVFDAFILTQRKSDAEIKVNKSGLCVTTGIKHILVLRWASSTERLALSQQEKSHVVFSWVVILSFCVWANDWNVCIKGNLASSALIKKCEGIFSAKKKGGVVVGNNPTTYIWNSCKTKSLAHQSFSYQPKLAKLSRRPHKPV